jgi:branched-chain amino acid transport system ATP-binding protein
VSGPLLAVEALEAGYGGLQVLFGVDLDVAPGEIVALMGSNGAGKTTTLRAVTGQLRPTGGRVLLDGEDVTGRPPEWLVRRGVALVPEGRGMLRGLSVEDNLLAGAWVVGDRARRDDALERAYATFPILQERRAQSAGTLSGGQQQMLALARAVMSSPRLLLVDEASLGLSPAMTATAFDLLRRLNEETGVAVLLVEQQVHALELAARAYVLEKGVVVDRADGADVRVMEQRLRAAYLGEGR